MGFGWTWGREVIDGGRLDYRVARGRTTDCRWEGRLLPGKRRSLRFAYPSYIIPWHIYNMSLMCYAGRASGVILLRNEDPIAAPLAGANKPTW